MSKTAAIVYSILMLFQSLNINIEELSKLGVLIEHAQYHQEMYGDTFLEFLYEHYGEQAVSTQNDHEEHDDLPFKSHQHIFCQVNFACILVTSLEFPLQNQMHQNTQLNFFYKEPISSFEKPTVFQPPKLA
ncbi:hypothetical protein FUA26_05355 [Seonamhaeicola algicola]|uniref:Uncharacterized protein n=1 Tax=Seonamhaeicola algicola TaxID=1719036 RepID=A0A5C7AXG3_9FLAO|nr:hypothetical protein [Seonamhaeicola algicola]TXE13221.1 hypothetical protein FUA26_05355 [Seonamhaeicola algicola]